LPSRPAKSARQSKSKHQYHQLPLQPLNVRKASLQFPSGWPPYYITD